MRRGGRADAAAQCNLRLTGLFAAAMDPDWNCSHESKTVVFLCSSASGSRHEKAVTHLCIGEENDMLYSCGEDAVVRGWNLSSARCDLICEGHESP